MTRWLDAEEINRLAAQPQHCSRMDTPGAVDLSRPFVPEEHTQLFHTPLYDSLTHTQRLRYNQLFGLRLNEYIMMLEARLIHGLLTPLCRMPSVREDPALQQAVRTVIEEEKRHHAGFAALNRACRPDLYPSGQDVFFSRLPVWTRAMFSAVHLLSSRYAFTVWYVMAMEESARTLARDMLREPETQTLGPLDTAFVAAHHEHMKDETRHVHVDALLIERCMPPSRARLNAWLFTRMLDGVLRPTRGGSGVRVIRQLVRDCPELAPREEALIQAVLALKDNPRFIASLFNRRIMPATFEMFDRCPALADLPQKLPGYDRREPH